MKHQHRYRRLLPKLLFLMLAGISTGAICVNAQAPSEAMAKANFSGRWKMLKSQSDFGTFTQPDIVVRAVDHHDPTLNVHTVQTTGKKTSTADVSYYTDGRESTNTMSGRDATSKSFWDGAALMVRTLTKNSKNEETEIVDRWELSPEGKFLTVTSHITTRAGEANLKLVCQKEE